MNAPLLEISGLSKRFAVPVLRRVGLTIRRGEIRALLGANGAGKSTLARIISGLLDPNGGEMRLLGEPFAPRGKTAAESAGVQMVMQELHLLGTLTVAENLYLNRLPRRFGFVDSDSLDAMAREALGRVGLADLSPDTRTGRLGIGEQQLVEIAAALARHCRLLILDEPTASLTDPQIELLFDNLRRLKNRGVGVLYISHRMEEIKRIADTVTVLRDGAVVHQGTAKEQSTASLIEHMAGESVMASHANERRIRGSIALRAEGLARGRRVAGVDLTVYRGEILGIAGLVGSGRTELLRLLFGADRPNRGRLLLGQEERPMTLRSPRDAVRNGIGMLPENRKELGLLLPRPWRTNVTLGSLASVSTRPGWIRTGRERSVARRFGTQLSIQSHSVDQPAAELSGGNQQKVVLARWLFRDCDVLLFDEPTKGIDVGARRLIHEQLARLADAGKALVVVSSELDELMDLCDRIAVMARGRIARVFDRGAWTRDRLVDAAFGE